MRADTLKLVQHSFSTWCLVLLLGCGRTGLNSDLTARPPGTPTPIEIVPCLTGGAEPQHLINANRSVITSLAVEGNELFVASRDVFIPMDYRSEGTVERFSRCGGERIVVSDDEDNPRGLRVGGEWFHWTSDDHNSAGVNRHRYVKSRQRFGTRLLDRARDASSERTSLALFESRLRWLERRGENVVVMTSEEDQPTAEPEATWILAPGSWQLLDRGEALVLLRRDAQGTEARLYELSNSRLKPLWSSPDKPDAYTHSPQAIFYTTWDASRLSHVIKRQALTDLAQPQSIGDTSSAPQAMIWSNGSLYYADERGLHRLTLDTGALSAWLLPFDAEHGEYVSAMTIVDGRWYFARSWSRMPSAPASVWVLELSP